MRNSIVYGMGATGIRTAAMGSFGCRDVAKYNNTLYNNGTGIAIGSTTTTTIINNLIVGNRSGGSASGSTNIMSDSNLWAPNKNLWAPNKATWSEGTHSLIRSSSSGLMVNPGGANLRLVTGSPVIDGGVDLSPTGFASAFDGASRPQGSVWDIGAYEFGSIPSPPMNLRVNSG